MSERPNAVPVGAGEACDLLASLKALEDQDQKIAAFGSSYGRGQPIDRMQPNAVL